jgi:hypothetical protein
MRQEHLTKTTNKTQTEEPAYDNSKRKGGVPAYDMKAYNGGEV